MLKYKCTTTPSSLLSPRRQGSLLPHGPHSLSSPSTPPPLALGGKPLTLLHVRTAQTPLGKVTLSLPPSLSPSRPTAALLRRPAPASPSSAGPQASPSSAGPHRPRPPPPARAGPRRPSSLLSPCHVPRAHAHSCQRTRASELTASVAAKVHPPPVAAALPRHQGPAPPPSPPLPVAAKVRRPPRRRCPPSPPRSCPTPSPPLPVATKVRRPPRRRSSPSESPPRSAAPDLPGLSPTPWPENDPSIPQASGRRVSPASRRVNRVSQHEPPPVLPAKAARRFAPLVHAMLAPK